MVVPVGEIDLATRDLLRSALEASHGDVVVDLSGVSFLDSEGIAVLIAQRKRLIASSGSLQLRDAQPAMRKVLEIAGLETLIAEERA
ncbi:MAG TPA: STAS domain-containing protein [Acidimicrobiia bacterium]|nr:STAS domain-containing protein [Acidimicrobiia bacterium]